MAKRQIIYEVNLTAKQAVQESARLRIELEKQKKERAEINKRVKESNQLTEADAKALNRLESEMKTTRKELRLLNREITAENNSLEDQRAELARLKNAYANLDQELESAKFGEIESRINSLTASITEQEQGIGVFSRNVGNYKSAFDGLLPSIGAINPAVAGAFAVTKIVEATVAVAEYAKELNETRKQVQQLTGATGDALDSITGKVQATAAVFDADLNDVLVSANSLSKQLGITQEQAIDEIQKGFALGANVSGEFLDVLREYPAQFKNVGLTAQESIAIITQQVQDGVFSDKGVDAIKEAGERLGRLEKPATDALNALGINQASIEEKGILGIIKEASARISELPPQSAVANKAIEGIFGTPGVDAGRKFLENLQNINGNLDDQISKSGELIQLQFREVQAQERLDTLYNQLLGSSGAFFDRATVAGKEFLANVLERLVNGVISGINYFRELYNEAIVFRGIVNGIGAAFNTVTEAIKTSFSFLREGFSSTGELIRAVLTGNFAEIPNIIQESSKRGITLVKEAGNNIAKGYIDGFKSTVEPAKLELISLTDSNAIQQAMDNAINTGRNLGRGLIYSFTSEANQIQSVAAITEQVRARLFQQEQEIFAATQDMYESELISISEILEAQKQTAEIRRQINEENTERELSNILAITRANKARADNIVRAFGEASAIGKAAAIASKAFATTDIIISARQAIMATIAQAAKIPPPFNIAFQIAQIGFILGEKTAALKEVAKAEKGGLFGIKTTPNYTFPIQRESTESNAAFHTVNTNPQTSYAAVPIYANGGIPSGAANLPTTSGISPADVQAIVNSVISDFPKQYVGFDAYRRIGSTYTETVSNADISTD